MRSLYEVRTGSCDLGIGGYVRQASRDSCTASCVEPESGVTGLKPWNICCLDFSTAYSK